LEIQVYRGRRGQLDQLDMARDMQLL